LGDALRIAINAGIFAHDVLDGFYGGGEVAHLFLLLSPPRLSATPPRRGGELFLLPVPLLFKEGCHGVTGWLYCFTNL
jgi:hypothetical protein